MRTPEIEIFRNKIQFLLKAEMNEAVQPERELAENFTDFISKI